MYKATVNGKTDALSHIQIRAHYVVLQLTDEGVSFEKMPIVIGLVMTLLFGTIEYNF